MVYRRRVLAVAFLRSCVRSWGRSVRKPRPTVTVLVGVLSLVISSLAVSVLLRQVAVAASDTISTVAGTGVFGFSGDGGPATAAQLNFPEDVAVDAAGNLFIVDNANSRVRRVSPTGAISTVAGTGVFGFRVMVVRLPPPSSPTRTGLQSTPRAISSSRISRIIGSAV